MKSKLLRELKNPSNKYRGKPFWSWNGDLDTDELFRQIDAFREMGFGGYFMHSRVGLETEYLGDKWFELINCCADYGDRTGMDSYIYDEDRWPSGIAGGIVTQNPEYRAKYLSCELINSESFKWKKDYIAAFVLDLKISQETNCYKYTFAKQLSPEILPEKGLIVAAFYAHDAEKSDFYNGNTYLDTLNPKATDAFIKSTHEKYLKKCGEKIGSKIKAIFTDEPHRGGLFVPFKQSDKASVPYTPAIFDEYKKRFSDSLIDKLPELFFNKDGEEVSIVKWRFVELLQQLFIENFFVPVKNWCAEHNISLTGHALHEDALSCQVAMTGSMMRVYPFMHIPGVDVLGNNHKFWIVKQLVSSARQYGQSELLSELYGCIGWQSTFDTYKSVGDWQALFGITLRCPHLSWYTMKGQGKRDFPASIGHQSAWYKDYKYIEDYYARIATLMSEGKQDCELLVINPVESVWSRVRYDMFLAGFRNTDNRAEEIQKLYELTFMALSKSRIDFDYGDEGLMAEMASVTKGGLLKIGKCKYKKVLVCGADNLRSSTVRVLEKFASLGGEIIFAGDLPSTIDCLPSDRISRLADKGKCISFSEIPSACKSGREVAFEGENPEYIFAQTRLCKNERYTLLINTSETTDYGRLEMCLGEGESVYEFNLRSGNLEPVDFTVKNGKIYLNANFPALREHAYIIKTTDAAPVKAKPEKAVKTITLPEEYAYELSEENIYVMDSVCYRINGGRWSKPDTPLASDKKIREKLKLNYRGGYMLQPWFIKKHHPEKLESKANVDVRYSFYIKNKPKIPVYLVIESAHEFKISVNGNKIDFPSCGKWIDICQDKFTLPLDWIKPGKNEVVISTDFNLLTNIEDAYLIGDFGVVINENNKPYITKLPKKLCISDISNQGLPFYSGSVTYKTELKELRGKKAELYIPSFGGALAKVSCGKKTEMLCWAPYRADITSLISRSGKLNITVTMTRSNTFGPGYSPSLHGSEELPPVNEYVLLPQGLLKSPEITFFE